MSAITAWTLALGATSSAVAAGFVLRGAATSRPAGAQTAAPVQTPPVEPPLLQTPIAGPTIGPTPTVEVPTVEVPQPPSVPPEVEPPNVPNVPKVVSGPWTMRPVPVAGMCSGQSPAIVPREGTLPERLSDHMPDASPVRRFEVNMEGPAHSPDVQRPWDAPKVEAGLQAAYYQGFNDPNAAGGFVVWAHEYGSVDDAIRSVRGFYHVLVCEYGADRYEIQEEPRILVAARRTDLVTAVWVHGRRTIQVDYHLWGEWEKDLADALAVTRAAWDVPLPPG